MSDWISDLKDMLGLSKKYDIDDVKKLYEKYNYREHIEYFIADGTNEKNDPTLTVKKDMFQTTNGRVIKVLYYSSQEKNDISLSHQVPFSQNLSLEIAMFSINKKFMQELENWLHGSPLSDYSFKSIFFYNGRTSEGGFIFFLIDE